MRDPAGLPLEELLFGFGMYWSCIYEHVTWRERDALREPFSHAAMKGAR